MAEFLSDEWIAALASASGGEAATRADGDGGLVVEPVVRGVPGRGEVRYRVSFIGGACSVGATPSGPDEADVCLETDYETAAALARGDLNAQAALADGRLRVSGDVARLAAHAPELAGLSDLFAAVRSTTTYPGVRNGTDDGEP